MKKLVYHGLVLLLFVSTLAWIYILATVGDYMGFISGIYMAIACPTAVVLLGWTYGRQPIKELTIAYRRFVFLLSLPPFLFALALALEIYVWHPQRVRQDRNRTDVTNRDLQSLEENLLMEGHTIAVAVARDLNQKELKSATACPSVDLQALFPNVTRVHEACLNYAPCKALRYRLEDYPQVGTDKRSLFKTAEGTKPILDCPWSVTLSRSLSRPKDSLYLSKMVVCPFDLMLDDAQANKQVCFPIG